MSTAAASVPLIACRGVTVTHGHRASEVTALRDVELEMADAESVALWGRSGSGKTTLLHVLGGLLAPSAGEVSWRGRPLSTLDQAARAALRARGIAYVFQGVNLLPYLTAFENLIFALRAKADADGAHSAEADTDSLADTAPPEPAARARVLLELVGLADKADSLPAELSGGEAQRVAIARALAQQPELLLCDEPTGQLDSDTGRRILDLIEAAQAEFGFALAVATHDEDVAARYGRTIGLSDGAVIADIPVTG
jgi:predicted ABC-type transport system involved in lysophospholipase L1 biosynthesis ATPase subunit